MKNTFHRYQRPFKMPLQTNHGVWNVREGIIVKLRDEQGRIAQGEIAPIPWFGSETLEAATKLCQQFTKEEITPETIAAIPNCFPACQFGFGSALEDLNVSFKEELNPSSFQSCILLPTGESALTYLEECQGIENTFKWKIGVKNIESELNIFHQLVTKLPPHGKLRLDANGGLTLPEAERWLATCELMDTIEFLEQPLPPEQFDHLLKLNEKYATSLALDESVATFEQLEKCYYRGWRGIFVLKAGILGFPQRLRQFCHNHPIDTVFSSVFETEIGRKTTFRLAAELSTTHRALGFGVDHWFEDQG